MLTGFGSSISVAYKPLKSRMA